MISSERSPRGRGCAILCATLLGMGALTAEPLRISQVRTPDGVLEGVISADGKVRTFKGIPYAAPPVGNLRWKAPQPVQPWTGVRKASEYGPRCMQARVFDDMVFHDDGPSEDCLHLNLWMPAQPATKKLPVMVWIHGGGFVAGGSSEPRQDAGNLSKKGVLVVSMNYRMGIFGFFSHPELDEESGHDASGNYGLMDQVAALQWVKKNIALFGGDPENVTIFGESAGSFSVSALMASPLAQGLFQRAIGESGAYFGTTLDLAPRAQSEKDHLDFAQTSLGTTSLADLRAKPAAELLDVSTKQHKVYFAPNIDGYFLPEDVYSIYAKGKQSRVPLLAGWNADEGNYRSFFEKDEPTAKNYAARASVVFGEKAAAFLKVLPRRDGRGSQTLGAGSHRRPVHRLFDLEVDRDAPGDGPHAHLSLPIRPGSACRRWQRGRRRRVPLSRNRIRLQRALVQAAAVEAGGQETVGPDVHLLVELRQDRQTQRTGPPAMARLQQGERSAGDAPQHGLARGAGEEPGPL